MKVLYLTWGETPRAKGVYGSQVIHQLRAIKDQLPSAEVHLAAGLPLIHSGLVRERLHYRTELSLVRQNLLDIPLSLFAILAPQTFIYSKRYQFPFFHLLSNQRLANFISNFRPDVVHCRGYHATFAALTCRKKHQSNFKVIFDARGLWPEDSVLLGGIVEGSPDFRAAKAIERRLLVEADATVVVSDTMQEHYEKIGVSRCERIYVSAPVAHLKKTHRDVSLSGTKTLCYVGALSNRAWHTPYELFSVYAKFKAALGNTRLLIITTSDHTEILKMRGDIDISEIEITSTSTPQELGAQLRKADFGVLPYTVPRTPSELDFAKVMIGSKTAEFLGAGLPVLVNRHCGGAAAVIGDQGLGLCYDPQSLDRFDPQILLSLCTEDVRARAQSFAEQQFDYAANGKRYANLYSSLHFLHD